MKRATFPLLLAAIVAISHADASEYFTGDGTAYTLGDTSSGNCNMMKALDFATTDYAALNNDQWSGLQNCGRCAEVSCADDRCADQSKTVTVQILDRCPECKHGDLDLSPSVFATLTGSSPSRYTIKWRFVDCPVSGNVNYCLKGGSNSYWTAIQPTNVATGVTSLQINGKAGKMLDGAYYYLVDGSGQEVAELSSVTVSVTDLGGNTIKDTVSLSAGSCTSGSAQFPSSSGGGATPTTPRPTTMPNVTSTPVSTTAPPTLTPTRTPTTAAPSTTLPATELPTSIPTQEPSQQATVVPATSTPVPQQQWTPAPEATTATQTDEPVVYSTTAPAPQQGPTMAPATTSRQEQWTPAPEATAVTETNEPVVYSTTAPMPQQQWTPAPESTTGAPSTPAPPTTNTAPTTAPAQRYSRSTSNSTSGSDAGETEQQSYEQNDGQTAQQSYGQNDGDATQTAQQNGGWHY